MIMQTLKKGESKWERQKPNGDILFFLLWKQIVRPFILHSMETNPESFVPTEDMSRIYVELHHHLERILDEFPSIQEVGVSYSGHEFAAMISEKWKTLPSNQAGNSSDILKKCAENGKVVLFGLYLVENWDSGAMAILSELNQTLMNYISEHVDLVDSIKDRVCVCVYPEYKGRYQVQDLLQ